MPRSVARDIVGGVTIEALDEDLARVAGAARASSGSGAIDAVVMASAARRGDIVYSQDIEDLEALRVFFPGVRVLRA